MNRNKSVPAQKRYTRVLVAGSDTLSLVFQNVHKHPFLDMEKAVNRKD